MGMQWNESRPVTNLGRGAVNQNLRSKDVSSELAEFLLKYKPTSTIGYPVFLGLGGRLDSKMTLEQRISDLNKLLFVAGHAIPEPGGAVGRDTATKFPTSGQSEVFGFPDGVAAEPETAVRSTTETSPSSPAPAQNPAVIQPTTVGSVTVFPTGVSSLPVVHTKPVAFEAPDRSVPASVLGAIQDDVVTIGMLDGVVDFKTEFMRNRFLLELEVAGVLNDGKLHDKSMDKINEMLQSVSDLLFYSYISEENLNKFKTELELYKPLRETKSKLLTGKLFDVSGKIKDDADLPYLNTMINSMESAFKADPESQGLYGDLLAKGLPLVGILIAYENKNAYNKKLSIKDFLTQITDGVEFMKALGAGTFKVPESMTSEEVNKKYLGFMAAQQVVLGPVHFQRGVANFKLPVKSVKAFYEFFSKADGAYTRASTHFNGSRSSDNGLGLDRPELRHDAPFQFGNALYTLTVVNPVERLIAKKVVELLKSGTKTFEKNIEGFVKKAMMFDQLSKASQTKCNDLIMLIKNAVTSKLKGTIKTAKDENMQMAAVCEALNFDMGIGTKYEMHGFDAVLKYIPTNLQAVHHMGIGKHKPMVDATYKDVLSEPNKKGKLKVVKTKSKEHASTQVVKISKEAFAEDPVESKQIFKALVKAGIIHSKSRALRSKVNVFDPHFKLPASIPEASRNQVMAVLRKSPNLYRGILRVVGKEGHLGKAEGFGTSSKIRRKDGKMFEYIPTHMGVKTSSKDVLLALATKVKHSIEQLADKSKKEALLENLSFIENHNSSTEEHDIALKYLFENATEMTKEYVNLLEGYKVLHPNESVFTNREGREAVVDLTRGFEIMTINGIQMKPESDSQI